MFIAKPHFLKWSLSSSWFKISFTVNYVKTWHVLFLFLFSFLIKRSVAKSMKKLQKCLTFPFGSFRVAYSRWTKLNSMKNKYGFLCLDVTTSSHGLKADLIYFSTNVKAWGARHSLALWVLNTVFWEWHLWTYWILHNQ